MSELIAQHLNAMHSARKAFISCESSEKLRRAIRHKTRDIMKIIYKSGDTVYYRKNDCSYWKEPGKVIGMGNKQVFVRHGGTYLRVHPCNLRLVKDYENEGKIDNNMKGDLHGTKVNALVGEKKLTEEYR